MNITVVCVGKIKEKFFTDAISEYLKRLSRFAKTSVIEVRDEKIPENASLKECELVLEKEAESILSKIPKNSYVVTLCIEGDQLSSPALADKIKYLSMEHSHITFIIGGSLGLHNKVKELSGLRLSFGKITLPHQLMRVVLLEQIYRSFKILSNESYHK
ncbi:MAG: 23S rRNA (pseudouridine(1915)-N(3))-methyltransferase RlmH [Clostridia bacterium]|nr:23S rRNA (pseudouridine(1915)-N(3))-methyltransferase RlmH [Clostridia bacterium]